MEIKQKVSEGLELGVELGWWPSFDLDRLEPDPWPTEFILKDIPEHERTIAHCLHKAELFKSVSEAARNGFSRDIIKLLDGLPSPIFERKFRKGTVHIIIFTGQ